MNNPLIGTMNNINPMAMLAQIKQNPLAFLRQRGFNVPENLNDPNAIIQHLMNSGQVTQAQFDNAQRMAQAFRRR